MVEWFETVFKQLLGGKTHLGYGSTQDAFETRKTGRLLQRCRDKLTLILMCCIQCKMFKKAPMMMKFAAAASQSL